MEMRNQREMENNEIQSNLVQWNVSLSTAAGLELGDL